MIFKNIFIYFELYILFIFLITILFIKEHFIPQEIVKTIAPHYFK